MATCHNCHNIRPRTVDRCPVCGAEAPILSGDEHDASEHPPGWSIQPDEADGSGQERALHPDDFLAQFEYGADPDAYPSEDRAPEGPPIPVQQPTPPPLPPAEPVLPPPTAESGEPASQRLEAEPPLVLPPPSSPAATAGSPILDERVVKAASTRLIGNIRVGARPRHAQTVIGAAAAGVIVILGGFIVGSAAPIPDATLAYRDDAQVATEMAPEDLALLAAQEWAADNDDAFVQLDLNGCRLRGAAAGIAVDRRTILVPASRVATDPTPTVVTSDGTRINGSVVGTSSEYGLAVVRTVEHLPRYLTWSIGSNVGIGAPVVVTPMTASEPSPALDTVADIERRGATKTSLELAGIHPPGSVVTQPDGLALGIIDGSGIAAISADVLAPLVSRAILNPVDTKPVCPVPDEPETDEVPTTEQPAPSD